MQKYLYMQIKLHSEAMTTTPASNPATTREEWLVRAMPDLIRWVRESGGKPFATPFVSVGFPSKGGLATKKRTLGQCWTIPNERRSHIFVSPLIDDPLYALGILTHELIHAATPGAGHKGAFKEVARDLGMEGKPTECLPGPKLQEQIKSLAERIGTFPHRALTAEDVAKLPKQGIRHRKIECPGCGYICRASKKWIEVGLPTCCCGEQMIAEDDEDAEPVVILGADEGSAA
jgi:hypothetical protein